MRTSIIAVAGLVAMVAPAEALETLAGGALFGGPSQTRAICYFYNAGNQAVTIKGMQIRDRFGTIKPLVINECGPSGSSLGKGVSCGIAANIVNNLPHSCKVRVDPSKDEVRGVLEIRDGSQNVLQSIDLR